MKSYILKLTSAVAIDGQIARAGSLVELDEATAKNLLHRGKAVLATEEDGVEQPGEDDAEAAELSKMNKAQLLEFCAQHGIQAADGMTKAQILEAITAAKQEAE